MSFRHLIAISLLLCLQSACHDASSTAASAVGPVAAAPTESQESPAAAPDLDPVPTTDNSEPLVSTAVAVAADNGDGAAPATWQAYQQSLKRHCETDADCVVKNVGNCCGYYPQCVHRDVQASPATVKALCEREQRQSICGFEEPTGCQCVNNMCQSGSGAL